MATQISFLIPVYNVEKYIERCLNSIYQQIIDLDCEVILVDDGSKDSSSTLCDKYAERYPTITKVYHRENAGAYPARNFALEHSHGEYLWFIDPDDFIQEGAVANVLTFITLNNQPDVISMSYKKYDGVEYSNLLNEPSQLTVVDGYEYLKTENFNPYLWANLYKRDFIISNRLRFIDNIYSQGDWVFNMEVAAVAKRIALTDIYAYNYFVANATSTLANPSPLYRLRGADNSMVVQRYFVSFLKRYADEEFHSLMQDYLSFIVTGFVYSLFRFHFETGLIREYLKQLKFLGLYPIPRCANRKANLFHILCNSYFAFIIICKLRNMLTRQAVIRRY